MLANRDLGVVMFQPLWGLCRRAAGEREDGGLASALRPLLRCHHGTAQYELVNLVLRAQPRAGAGLRLVRLAGDRASLMVCHDKALSRLPELDGFCLALTFVDPDSQQAISQTVFRDAQALAASRSAAAAGRVEAIYGTDLAVRGVEEFSLGFSSTDWE